MLIFAKFYWLCDYVWGVACVKYIKIKLYNVQWIRRKHRDVVKEAVSVRQQTSLWLYIIWTEIDCLLYLIFSATRHPISVFHMRQYVSNINHFANSISFMVCLRRSMLQHRREPLKSTLNQLLYNCLVARICLFAYFIDVTQSISCRISSLPLFSVNYLLNKSVYDERRYHIATIPINVHIYIKSALTLRTILYDLSSDKNV